MLRENYGTSQNSLPVDDQREQAGKEAGAPTGERPQRPLRAAFQLATTAKLPWQEHGNG